LKFGLDSEFSEGEMNKMKDVNVNWPTCSVLVSGAGRVSRVKESKL
jgi:hypothetical protein